MEHHSLRSSGAHFWMLNFPTSFRCLSVPACWSNANKQAMRDAALRAGFIRTPNSDDLAIVYEPEAAAIHALVDAAQPPLLAGGSGLFFLICIVRCSNEGFISKEIQTTAQVPSQLALRGIA